MSILTPSLCQAITGLGFLTHFPTSIHCDTLSFAFVKLVK